MSGSPAISDFRLDNGLSVVVIPDHRAPVVTHMVWAPQRLGRRIRRANRGIAHFLEHLMFKGTKAHPQGQFSEVIAELGGQENAFTGNDYNSAYFQRIAKEHLGVMMEFEADRMTVWEVLTDEIVAPERDVIPLKERRTCIATPIPGPNSMRRRRRRPVHPSLHRAFADHRLEPRNRGPEPYRRARVLSSVLHAGKRHPDCRRRCRSG